MLQLPGVGISARAHSRAAQVSAVPIQPARLWRSAVASGPGLLRTGSGPASAGRPDVRCRDTPPQATASPSSPPKPAAAPAGTTTWQATLFTGKTSFLKGKKKLRITIKGEDGSETTPVEVSSKAGWTETAWDRPGIEADGTIHKGAFTLPSNVVPAVIILEQTIEKNNGKDSTYLASIELTAQGKPTVEFPADTFVYANGPRVIFDGKGRLPAQTPPALRALREQELKDLQGVGNPAATETRKVGDRIYDYQTYNDLGGNAPDGSDHRPALGGSAQFPYPRRLRTGRPLYPGRDAEKPPTTSGTNALNTFQAVPWMPADDDFDADKAVGFIGNALTSFLPGLQVLFSGNSEFRSIEQVLKLFDNDEDELAPLLTGKPAPTSGAAQLIEAVYSLFRTVTLRLRRAQFYLARQQAGNAGLKDIVGDFVKNVVAENDDLDDFFEYPVPYNLAGRAQLWDTDEEFGRQYVAGQNPLALAALRHLPASTSIKIDDLKPFVEGQDVAALLAAERPRLFLVDFYTLFDKYADMINGKYLLDKRVQHAGHAVLYRRNDGHLVPIAIDLTTSSTIKPTVFTPSSPGVLWPIAKAVFASIDSGHHQLISHWLRTHASVEPYLIATRRHLSTWHPVFDLIMPHFRYTMPINANARSSLINANGVIEKNFTPAEFSMRLSAEVYGAVWRFDQEALPADLAARGLLRESVGPDGKAKREVLLDDYPYAEDGLLVWESIETYFADYLNLYYETDEDVQTDNEIQAWWEDIKTKGHPDKKEGWPALATRADLVRILATIAWVGSGHHAAVNFGQYDYSAFMPNRSSIIRRAMPAPGESLYTTLANINTPIASEEALLGFVGTPQSTSTIATVVKLLSSHAEDEQYLSDPKQQYLVDDKAKAAHARFVKRILETEAIIAQRNTQPSAKSVSRDVSKSGLAYNYLIATSPKSGVTGRGVPYSISI